MKSTIANWGNYPFMESEVFSLINSKKSIAELSDLPAGIPRGMGRCYGDSALADCVISTLKLNRFLAFNQDTGVLTCESGVTFEDILNTFVPKGWFPPVTPGTKFVSMGGAIASDVHGKNHHKEGSFFHHTFAFDILTAAGEIKHCSRTENPTIFQATFGGMGLTGIVLSLTIQLKKIETAFIQTENIKARNLTHVLELLDEFENATYTVAWTDCLSKGSQQGRSILMKGEHAALSEIQGTKFATAPLGGASSFKAMVPFYFPSFALNSLTVKAFNFLYYHKQTSPIVRKLTHYDSFFYPLDAIYYWNRIYGKRGFTQYQFVIPKEKGQVGLKKIMDKISDKGMGSFLVVLKSFGAQESPFLSFPQAGYTLAMDFPIEPKLFPFLAELDEIVLEYGGRVYLTKDTRLPADTFRKMYPNLPMFQSVLAEINATRKWQSLQSMRLEI